jgi:hypothetical protein
MEIPQQKPAKPPASLRQKQPISQLPHRDLQPKLPPSLALKLAPPLRLKPCLEQAQKQHLKLGAKAPQHRKPKPQQNHLPKKQRLGVLPQKASALTACN